ncbi:enoyl-CoA hydratase/isomerase family protein [Pseudacidovorax sp. NFM-22]|uniref:enoyl-CoA hydratase/isomerase family protein n=1 Tax=Pseudacidovorax sp. NFM-22 TaxID=2744469 RepID=UPI001F427E1D|nr:enoyl-CoA hydratase/isomerase family protein [Pseudacidovorax sp. NFM-22]
MTVDIASPDLPLLTYAGGIATIRLNRPLFSNWVRDEDLRWILSTLLALDADPAVKVVVLTANTGGQARPVFCGGYEITEANPEARDALFTTTTTALAQLRPVTLCALSGSVYGPALDLVLACDIRVAVSGTTIHLPMEMSPLNSKSFYARVGRHLGIDGARRAFLSGNAISAEELGARGVFEGVVRPDAFDGYVGTLARQIATLEARTIQSVKQALDAALPG